MSSLWAVLPVGLGVDLDSLAGESSRMALPLLLGPGSDSSLRLPARSGTPLSVHRLVVAGNTPAAANDAVIASSSATAVAFVAAPAAAAAAAPVDAVPASPGSESGMGGRALTRLPPGMPASVASCSSSANADAASDARPSPRWTPRWEGGTYERLRIARSLLASFSSSIATLDAFTGFLLFRGWPETGGLPEGVADAEAALAAVLAAETCESSCVGTAAGAVAAVTVEKEVVADGRAAAAVTEEADDDDDAGVCVRAADTLIAVGAGVGRAGRGEPATVIAVTMAAIVAA